MLRTLVFNPDSAKKAFLASFEAVQRGAWQPGIVEFILSFSFSFSGKPTLGAGSKYGGWPWRSVLALLLMVNAGAAHALSTACSTLNSTSGTTSYVVRFASTDFAAGESISFSYEDNGQDPGTNPTNSNLVNIRSRNLGTVYSDYRSSTRTLGIQTPTVSASQLAAGGLYLQIVAGTYIGPVTISCTGAVAEVTPVAGVATATVAANSSNNPITLAITGTATAVAVASAAAHGTATASGTSISYTPAAGYSGADSFTYTASNGAGTSSAATVSITVSRPTLVITPSSGALPGGQVGASYSQALSSSGGTAPYSYSVTGLPAGISVNPSSGALSGTPTATGNYNLSILATDANGATGSASYTLAIAPAPPVAGAVSATVAANSSSQSITLNLSGGAANSVAIAAPPSHGQATVSGLSILYTPTPGFSGADSLSYTAANASGTSAPATLTITVTASALVLSPASGALPNGQVGVAYNESISATGGVAPYHYSATGLPNGLNLDPSSGLISGVATSAGHFSVALSVSDNAGGSGSASYTLDISEPLPVAGAVSATVAANTSNNALTLVLSGGTATAVTVVTAPAHGQATASGTSIRYSPNAGYSGADSFTYSASNASGTSAPATVTLSVTAPSLGLSPAAGSLPAATVGTAYSQVFSASGGASPYRFSASGLPAGLSLDPASGSLTGTPTTAANVSFSIVATDANGVPVSAAYSLVINGSAPQAVDSTVSLGAGQSVNVDLGAGATGGPFVSATLLDVPPSSMGTARLNGLKLSFTPAANASGTLTLRYSLINGQGQSVTATLTIQITPRKDPSQNAEVAGMVNAQAQSAAQFAKAQISNFNDRLEQLHGMDGHRNAFNLRFALSPAESAQPQPDDGLGIFRSLSALQAKDDQWALQRAAAAPAADPAPSQDLSLWTGGYVDFGKSQRSGAKVSNTLIGISGGMDYRLSPSLTVGAGIGLGKDKSDIGSSGTTSRGDAYSAALYGSYHPGPVFLDALLGYSWLSFDSDRYVTDSGRYAQGNRRGDQLFGSLSSGYEARGQHWLLSPYARLDASTTWLRAFSEADAGADNLEYADQRLSLLSSVAGLRGQYGIPLGWSYLNLRSRLEYSHTFNTDSTARMGYADIGDLAYSLRTEGLSQDTLSASLGVDFLWLSGLSTGIGYQGTRAFGDSSRSDSISFRLAHRF